MSLIIISEVGEGNFMKGMGGSNYCLSVRGGGVQCLGLHRCSLPCIHKIRKRVVLGLGLSTSVDP